MAGQLHAVKGTSACNTWWCTWFPTDLPDRNMYRINLPCTHSVRSWTGMIIMKKHYANFSAILGQQITHHHPLIPPKYFHTILKRALQKCYTYVLPTNIFKEYKPKYSGQNSECSEPLWRIV